MPSRIEKKADWAITLSVALQGVSAFIAPSAKLCESAIVRGNVYIGKNTFVGDGVVIIGPCFIGDDVTIGAHNIIQRSHVGDRVTFGTRSYISDSLIEEDAWISNISTANTKLTANFSDKAGVFIGAEARIGIGVITMPGISIHSRAIIYPGVILSSDVDADTIVRVQQQQQLRMRARRTRTHSK